MSPDGSEPMTWCSLKNLAEAPEELVFLHSRVMLTPASTGWSRPTRITKVSETRLRLEDSRLCSGVRGCGYDSGLSVCSYCGC